MGSMSNFLLSVHVLGAILAIGPVAVAASMFPPAARRGEATVAGILHRITRVYAVIGILVPVFGVATAVSMGILTQAWLLVSMGLTAGAAVVLISQVIPLQARALAGLSRDGSAEAGLPKRLAMTTGMFNLIWAVVVLMMIYRPGQGG